MTSLQFYDHSSIEPRQAVEWGTGNLQTEKFDPTTSKAPTFILKNQPITQFYRESNIELSNLDNLYLCLRMLAPFKENLLDKKILQRFPLNHPLTSQISLKALFPNFTSPEDPSQGDRALNAKSLHDKQTPAQVEHSIVVNKQSGKPWRHEIHYPPLPSQQPGLWYNDKEFYHYPKPNYNQQFYPSPPSLLVPNPRLRSSAHSIDSRTANVLRNKEKELKQSTQRIDYYPDGLGTRAVLNSDNLEDKKVRFADTDYNNQEMKPYFRKGAGISKSTIEFKENLRDAYELLNPDLSQSNLNEYKPLTKVEQDQILLEHGNNYRNFPQSNYINNTTVPTFQKLEFNRSNTMPIMKSSFGENKENSKKEPSNKLDAEKSKINLEKHQRMQKLEYENRRNDIELILPSNDIRVLRINSRDLENSRGAQPNLRQNYQQHVNSLYQQESKYLGERAELYKPHTYNPHLLKQYVESVKDDSKVSANFSNGSGYPSQKDVHILNETYEHRPKLFADKVFTDYKNIKREPLENVLLNPNISAESVLQENGFIQQQTIYGQSYSTKKYMQENQLVQHGNSNNDLLYTKLDPAELEYQNITLKSRADQIAFNDYKNGYTDEPNNMKRANEIVVKIDKEAKETEYPRYSGPIPPEPYEPLYCNTQISEMSDGNSKRAYSRVYDSPNVKPQSRYEPLRSDLEAIHKYEKKALGDLAQQEEYLKQLYDQTMQNTQANRISFVDKSNEIAARRSLDKISILQQDQRPTSTYNASYTSYAYDELRQCPPNEYYNSIEYTVNPSTDAKIANDSLPNNLISLQDSWSKSSANSRYHSAYSTQSADLRENIHTGKKIIYDAPANAHRFA